MGDYSKSEEIYTEALRKSLGIKNKKV